MYTVTDLVPDTVVGSTATAVNRTGMVVGTIAGGAGFVWVPSQPNGMEGTYQLLPATISPAMRDVTNSSPEAVNSSGTTVGYCTTVDMKGTEVMRAFRISSGALGLEDLGTFAPDAANPGHWLGNSAAFGINDAGDVVGWADNAAGVRRAFLLRAGSSQMEELTPTVDDLPDGKPGSSRAVAINNSGVIVGTRHVSDAAGNIVEQAFNTQIGLGGVNGLGTLLPNPLGGFFGNSSGQALSDTGVFVGDSDALPAGSPVSLNVAVVFGNPTVPLAPGSASLARAINEQDNRSHVVGYFTEPAMGTVSAFIWEYSTGFYDLNTQLRSAGWHIEDALGINAVGQICGIGQHPDLEWPRAVLLSPP